MALAVAHLCLSKSCHPLDGLFGVVEPLVAVIDVYCQWECALSLSRLIQSRTLNRRHATKRSKPGVTESRGQLKPAAEGLPELSTGRTPTAVPHVAPRKTTNSVAKLRSRTGDS